MGILVCMSCYIRRLYIHDVFNDYPLRQTTGAFSETQYTAVCVYNLHMYPNQELSANCQNEKKRSTKHTDVIEGDSRLL